jgi:AcrR family transcriptional regulator
MRKILRGVFFSKTDNLKTMTPRQEEIIKKAISLFNTNGVSNVKLVDITIALDISLGNLTYYYKTKKDLIAAILDFMVEDRKNLLIEEELLLNQGKWKEMIQNYLMFQLKYGFFYRDILDLDLLNEGVKTLYKIEVNKVIDFNRNSIHFALAKDYIKPEPKEGIYDGIAETIWSIYQAWFIKRAIFGEDKVGLDEAFIAITNLFYPYLTEKGLIVINRLVKQKEILV